MSKKNSINMMDIYSVLKVQNCITDVSDNDQNEQDHKEKSGEDTGTELLVPENKYPDKLYLIPATNRPFFPAQIQPLVFTAKHWNETLKRVNKNEESVLGLCYVDSLTDHDIDHKKFPKIGCAVKIHNLVEVDDQIQFIALGLHRFKIEKWLRTSPPYLVQVSYPKAEVKKTDTIKAYAIALINAIKELLPLNPLYSEELKNYLNRFHPREPSPLADFAAAITTAPGPVLQEVLEIINLQRRMEKVLTLIKREQELVRLQLHITEQVNKEINKNQREFFLKEQLKIIQKELGISKDDKTAEVEKFQQRLKNKTIPEQSQKKIDEEFEKFALLELGSPEFAVSRNYLDWATSLPWGIFSKDKLNLKNARNILNRDHYGLDDVKQRIIEFLAVGSYKGEIAGSILLFVGPPGVGKTSIGRSVAQALGRKFYRFSLGGMQDEAEIKGHRRTYIGALPGKIVQALKEVEVSNPVIMLDEIDKLGSSFKGDPASALLEVLDPTQNHEFLDHYLDLRVDLSKVLFICTANQIDTIPGPLRDRMDMIRLAGYITQEKLSIAKKHLWPKQLKKAGLTKKQIKLSDAALTQIIEGYAREAGVRQLEKLLARVIRKSVVKIIEATGVKDAKDAKNTHDETIIKIGPKELTEYLGEPYFRKEKAVNSIGVITGLAWTSLGGDTLPVEATKVHSHRAGFKLTGKLGDVMKESAEIAYSYILANLKKYKVPNTFFDKSFIHLHVPEGATPKDGPSAGITMASALLSISLNLKPKQIAMTGELTLTGKVLPVGGIREKITACRRNGIHELIVPYINERDYKELPSYIREGLTVHFAKHFDDVQKILFK